MLIIFIRFIKIQINFYYMKRNLQFLKNNLCMTALLLAGSTFAQVNSFPWLETFEDTSPTQTQWVCEYISGTNSSVTNGLFWSIKSTTSVGYNSSTGPYQGSKMAVFDTRSHSRDAIARFISPILDLSSSTGVTLDFYYRNMVWGSDQNELKVYYRTSSTSPWVLITTFNTNVPTFTNSGVINLPNLSSTYQIALEGVGKYGYGLDVDNLQITESTLSTHESTTKSVLSLAPNPAKDILNIKTNVPISEYIIFDLNGKKVMTSNNMGDFIDIEKLKSGMYILQTKDKNGNVNDQKFIKQ